MPYVFPTLKCHHVLHPCVCDEKARRSPPLVLDRDLQDHPRRQIKDVGDHGPAHSLAPDVRGTTEL